MENYPACKELILNLLNLFFYVFHIDFLEMTVIVILLLILANCVRNESCREKLEPTSPNGTNTQDAAIISMHRCPI